MNGPTPCLSPLVVLNNKTGDIRVCVDMHRANEAVVRERHPIPTIDEILEDMSGAVVFSKLNLKWGYHQIELKPESRSLATFVTHTGLWLYWRLMFGVSSAPATYQHIICQVLQGRWGPQHLRLYHCVWEEHTRPQQMTTPSPDATTGEGTHPQQ